MLRYRVNVYTKTPNTHTNRMQRREGPVVFVIMDGVGYGKNKEADAV